MAKNQENLFRQGFKDGLPIALGYLSVSFAFGMIAIQKGLSLWVPVVISLSNFTGTGQFAGVDLIALTAPLIEIAVTLLIINIRYTLMSLSLSQRLSKKMKLWQRLVVAFGNTDEIFAVAVQKNKTLSFDYMSGLIFCSFSGWNIGTFLGSFLGSLLPQSIQSALGIAIFGMFIAIIIPPAKKSAPILNVIITSVIISCMFKWIPGLNLVGGGWVIIICGVLSSALGAYLHPTLELAEDNCDEL